VGAIWSASGGVVSLMDALAVTVDEVTGKLNALIKVVDGIVRHPPQA